MICKRIVHLLVAAFVLAPFAASTAEAKESTQRRPAHIDRLAWRNSVSKAGFSTNDRPTNRSPTRSCIHDNGAIFNPFRFDELWPSYSSHNNIGLLDMLFQLLCSRVTNGDSGVCT